MGFDSEHNWGSIHFNLKRKNVYGGDRGNISLSISGLDSFEEIKENVEVILWTTKYSWVSIKCKRDCAEMIKTIDNFLKPLLLTNSIDDFKKQEPMTIENFEMTMKKLMNNLETQSIDYKEELINTLEKTLEQLKNEKD